MANALLIVLALSAVVSNAQALACFFRSDHSSSNGFLVTCINPSCSSYTSSSGARNAGCGGCSAQYPDCYNCSTSSCNTLTPSSISCFSRSTSLGINGSLVACHTGVTTCYSYTSGSYSYAGCGSCGASGSTNCITCSTDNCNTASSISCFSRSTTSSSTNGTMVTCQNGVTTCYSYTSGSYNYAGCGSCDASGSTNCITCSTDNCNTVTPSSISCFSRSTTSASTNGTMVACNSGINTCYSYTSGSYNYAGCGSCSSISSSCTSSSMCSTNYCNTVAPPINCYYSFASYLYGNRQKTICSTSSCYEYSFGYGVTNLFFAGCGSCSSDISISFNCRTCYWEYCNSASSTGVSVKIAAAAGVFLLAMMKLF